MRYSRRNLANPLSGRREPDHVGNDSKEQKKTKSGAANEVTAFASCIFIHAHARLAVFLSGGPAYFCLLFFSAHLSPGNAQQVDVDSGLIAHEWGTFTSIAGATGQAVEWLPLSSPSDFASLRSNISAAPASKLGWAETIRMETACALFFIPRHDATVDVSVFLFSRIDHRMVSPRHAHRNRHRRLENVVLFQQQSSGKHLVEIGQRAAFS